MVGSVGRCWVLGVGVLCWVVVCCVGWLGVFFEKVRVLRPVFVFSF